MFKFYLPKIYLTKKASIKACKNDLKESSDLLQKTFELYAKDLIYYMIIGVAFDYTGDSFINVAEFRKNNEVIYNKVKENIESDISQILSEKEFESIRRYKFPTIFDRPKFLHKNKYANTFNDLTKRLKFFASFWINTKSEMPIEYFVELILYKLSQQIKIGRDSKLNLAWWCYSHSLNFSILPAFLNTRQYLYGINLFGRSLTDELYASRSKKLETDDSYANSLVNVDEMDDVLGF